MAIQLKIDEMLDILHHENDTQLAYFVEKVEFIADQLASRVALALNIEQVAEASFQGTAFAGTCVPFMPSTPNQPIPAALAWGNFETQEWEEIQNG